MKKGKGKKNWRKHIFTIFAGLFLIAIVVGVFREIVDRNIYKLLEINNYEMHPSDLCGSLDESFFSKLILGRNYNG